MELVEVRRLTGPNLLLDGPAGVLDVTCADPATVLGSLRARLVDHLEVLRAEDIAWRGVDGSDAARVWHGDIGLTWAVTAPVDLLYAMCAVLEAVWDDVVAGLQPGAPVVASATQAALQETIDERDPALLELLAAAEAHGVAGVWDDDEVSVGLGRGSLTWARADVPHPDELPWDEVHDVPVAMVTGTNGKSTTVRMLAGILREAGMSPGNSSTDGIVVDGELVEEGDWSGPGGGRTVGRDRRVGAMVLETARGGLLRRGLPLERADVAVVTNVAADHLGEYGIETVDDLAQAKLVVAKAVRTDGVLVLNAEDERLVAAAPDQPTTWFAVDPTAPALVSAMGAGGTTWTVEEGALTRRGPGGTAAVVGADDIPATFGGVAAHNVANALAAAAAATALGVSDEDIAAGLRAFVPDADTNPGRANTYDLDGVTVVVDFAHNVHAVRAMAGLARALGGERTCVLFSQAGDRPDDALEDLAAAVHATGPDHYVVAEVPKYLRGREPMEVPRRLAAALHSRGVPEDAVHEAADAVAGTEHALDWARPGDVLLLLTLQHRAEVDELLRSRGATVTVPQ